jgi:hypothetical protein
VVNVLSALVICSWVYLAMCVSHPLRDGMCFNLVCSEPHSLSPLLCGDLECFDRALMADPADIIDLEKGYQNVLKNGIEVENLCAPRGLIPVVFVQPFINFIELQEREFFKAKDFVTLYE